MIGVIGLGFVGLTTALGFAEKNYQVACFDKDPERQKMINSGNIPFYEPFLAKILSNHLNQNLMIAERLENIIQSADILFYCVGTPSLENGRADLSILIDALKESLNGIKSMPSVKPKTIVIKSTVPPSTTQEMIKPIIEEFGFRVGTDIYLANNPEFLREGYAWQDFITPDRIVIGSNDSQSGIMVKSIYEPFNAPIFSVSLNTAEYIKYLSNTLLADLISFSNEMAIVADTIGAIDIKQSFRILSLDKRWSGNPANMTSYVFPGIGFGGYCLPKDTRAIYTHTSDKGYIPELLGTILATNQKIKDHFVEKIKKISKLDDVICVLGLAFKPESDDVRETPAKDIIRMLLNEGYRNIIATDPLAIDNFKQHYNLPITYLDNIEEAVQKSDIVIVLTAWEQFLAKKDLVEKKPFIDGRYFF